MNEFLAILLSNRWVPLCHIMVTFILIPYFDPPPPICKRFPPSFLLHIIKNYLNLIFPGQQRNDHNFPCKLTTQVAHSLATILTSKPVISIHWWQENHKIGLSLVPRNNSFSKYCNSWYIYYNHITVILHTMKVNNSKQIHEFYPVRYFLPYSWTFFSKAGETMGLLIS